MAELIDKGALMEQYGLKDATKYGNKDAEQQAHSYSTLMLYEIADMIDDMPTVTEAEIRANAISDIFEIMDNAVAHSSDHDERSMAYWVGFLKSEIEWAEQLKGE